LYYKSEADRVVKGVCVPDYEGKPIEVQDEDEKVEFSNVDELD